MLLLLATLSWSTAGLFVRVIDTDIPTTLLWRSFFGGLSLLIFCIIIKGDFNLKRALKHALSFNRGEIVAGTLSACGMVCFVSAFFFTTIANVTFAYGIVPLVTYGLAYIFLKDKLRVMALFCCGLAFIGVLIMVGGNAGADNYIGIGLGLLMTLAVAGMTIAAKFYRNVDAGKATYLAGFLAAAVMLPFASYGDTALIDYGWLALYGVVNVSLGFGLYFYGVKKCAALTASLITLCEIPLAPVWAWLLFAETINQGTFLGAIFIVSAVLLYVWRGYKG